MKEQTISKIKETGLVAVIRAENSDKAFRITEACIEGGIAAIEITFTVPGTHNVINDLSKKYSSSEIVIGAGTVLDSETARIAILSGADFIVSPCFYKKTVELCNRYQVACISGAMTIKEIVDCMEAGADIIKVFPGELFGPAMIKAVKGPLPHAQLMPTGGVSIDNVSEWIKAGAVAVGAGSSLTSISESGDYTSITTKAKDFLDIIKKTRESICMI